MRHSSWRRAGAVCAALTAAAIALAGCSGSSSTGSAAAASQSTDTSGQTLNYWLWVDNATDQTWQQLADQHRG